MSGAKASNAFYVALSRFSHRNVERTFGLQEKKQGLYNSMPMSGMHLAGLFALDEAIHLLLKNGCPIDENEESL